MSKDTKYIEGIGRRKSAIARVRIVADSKNSITINDKSVSDFIKVAELERVASEPLSNESTQKWNVTVIVKGGGISSQAEAIRLGLSRALIKSDQTLRSALKKEGFLKRDPRVKERRKFGLKKARKAPQWSKR